MEKIKRGCREKKKPHTMPRYIIYGFFSIGLISAIAFRAIIILQHFEPKWAKTHLVHRSGRISVFSLYQYEISQKRKRTIRAFQLIEKVKSTACLSDEDREVQTYLLTSIKVSL
jgi:hypothetical protein